MVNQKNYFGDNCCRIVETNVNNCVETQLKKIVKSIPYITQCQLQNDTWLKSRSSESTTHYLSYL